MGPSWTRRGFLHACTNLPRDHSRISRRKVPRKRRAILIFIVRDFNCEVTIMPPRDLERIIFVFLYRMKSNFVVQSYVVTSFLSLMELTCMCAWPSRRYRRNLSRQSARVCTFLITQNFTKFQVTLPTTCASSYFKSLSRFVIWNFGRSTSFIFKFFQILCLNFSKDRLRGIWVRLKWLRHHTSFLKINI